MGLGVLGAERSGHGHPGRTQLPQPLGDEFGADRLGIDLLHPRGGAEGVELSDLVEERLGVVIAGPQALKVEHRQATEAPQGDRGGR